MISCLSACPIDSRLTAIRRGRGCFKGGFEVAKHDGVLGVRSIPIVARMGEETKIKMQAA